MKSKWFTSSKTLLCCSKIWPQNNIALTNLIIVRMHIFWARCLGLQIKLLYSIVLIRYPHFKDNNITPRAEKCLLITWLNDSDYDDHAEILHVDSTYRNNLEWFTLLILATIVSTLCVKDAMSVYILILL